MTADERTDEPKRDDDWVKVGDAPPAETARDTAPPPEEQPKAYAGRQPTPPWKYSLYMGVIGLVLMSVIYIFPELRRFQTPWDPAFRTAYVLSVFPVFGLVWGVIGLLGKQFAGDRAKAWPGLLLSALTVGVAYIVVVTDPSQTEDTINQSDERLEMTPQELQEWRSEKLRQR